ncbi:FtsX-like permease family protein [Phytoactinopolyspora mesophila]|uniref:FtsX-like permease family protein n=1 Tax=Phytoactinopolyspora mesophila TaxID=2650750 RepID=A0A7K3M9N4_9ACTN|nr:FtsX-like permease family protein [Phytoactinopolyspora mesophila]NDL59976.1 FtsX-like permease family protein [Phytoactinopolyspora mesophila]
MPALALRSLRYRSAAFSATFVSVLLGTAVIGAFATLFEVAAGPVAPHDAEALRIMGAVVGGWGALIVLYSVASTVGITVERRGVEIGLLRTIGATPGQARRLVRVETLVVCLVAALLGALVASVAGRVLLSALRSSGLVASAEYRGGFVSLAITVAGVLVVCLGAAAIAGWRATRGAPSVAGREDSASQGAMPWWRIAVALGLIGCGIAPAIVTVTVTKNSADPYEAMATSGSNSIMVGIGLAVLAPLLLRVGAALARPVAGGRSVETYLAAYNTARRSHLLAGVLAPVIVLTSVSVGTLMLVGIDGRTLAVSTPDGRTINLLNNVVVAMLCLFAAIMVVNAFAVLVEHRRAELRRLWLLGATPAQVRGSVVAEAVVVAAVGIVSGLIASLTTMVPFAIARGEGLVPDGQLWLPPTLAAAVIALTVLSARRAVRRVVGSALAQAA